MSAPRRAFTLIELILAMGIGMVIILALYTSFRATMQAISHALAMSTENAILRYAYMSVLEEADFWTAYDWPEASATPANPDPGENPGAFPNETPTTSQGAGLRGHISLKDISPSVIPTSQTDPTDANPPLFATRQGAPFTRFIDSAGFVSRVTGKTGSGFWGLFRIANIDAVPRYGSQLEAERGHDRDFTWSASDPRTWHYGNTLEIDPQDDQGDRSRRGKNGSATHCPYGIMAMYFSPFAVLPVSGYTDTDSFYGGVYRINNTGSLEVSHHWLPNQLHALRAAVGEYAMHEYLPSNVYKGFYGQPNLDDTPAPVSPAPFGPVRNNENGTEYGSQRYGIIMPSRGLYSSYDDVSFWTRVIDAWQGGIQGDVASWQMTDTMGDSGQHVTMFQRATITRPLYYQKPRRYPDVQLSVARFMGPTHRGLLNSVTWTSTITQERCRVYINLFGTTLRGARQQRAQNGGWADWYGVGDPRNSKTLDDY